MKKLLTALMMYTVVIGSAVASPIHTFSHHMCRVHPTAGSQDYSFIGATYTNLSSTQDLRLDCPIVMPEGNFYFDFIAVDNHSTRDVRCTLIGSLSATRTSGIPKSSSGASSLLRKYRINVTRTVRDAHNKHLTCFIPPRDGNNVSRFHSYEYERY